ncbi:hypothetical protein [Micromonospora sp. HM5-17]|uniref:hypothetical protein n=1 Tax=Micromonospora sp. HM5-17 TaxID=2487710 RepID=UPI000F4995E3|nr:hypothetical protein [Micromonospora sp. HM5-17]ROT28284.1 hypothetical protein EF879_22050 [Micromonospora sp. HM5-17]
MTAPLSQTPGRLTAILAGVVALGLLFGATALVGVRQRADLVRGVTVRSGELLVAAQNLYRALSDADAITASAFLSNGLEPPELRERYQRDLADAAAALTVVSAATDGRSASAAARIAARLPVYSGLVETARTYNRQGLPLGVAYLQEASGLMRDELLPAARELYAAASAELDAARDRAAGFPWIATLLGLTTLGALVLAQLYLTRRTNRLLNVGLLVSTGAAVLLLGWLIASAVAAAAYLQASRDDGSAQMNLLAEARIAGLQARADEALTLVARGNGAAFEQHYVVVMEQLAGADGAGGLLGEALAAASDQPTRQAVETAIAQSTAWSAAHRQVRALDDRGEFTEAVRATIGPGDQTTAAIFNRLDEALAQAITYNGERFERKATSAGRALTGADVGFVVLTILILAGAVVGMQRRIMEYR